MTTQRLTLTAVAKASGLSLAHISRIVSGSRRPSPQVAKRLSDVTGLPREAWLYPQEHGDIVQALYAPPRIPAPTSPEPVAAAPVRVVGK